MTGVHVKSVGTLHPVTATLFRPIKCAIGALQGTAIIILGA